MTKIAEKLKKHPIILALALTALVVLLALVFSRNHQQEKKQDTQKKAASTLFTGKEPRAKASLFFAAKSKSMPEPEPREIYLTESINARARQVVQGLLDGPKQEAHLPVFPSQAALRSLFIAKDGVCVVDFTQETAASHPGGSTGEYVTLYCLVRSLTDSLPEVQKVQVLIEGRRVASLAGHYDLWEPLDKSSF